MRPITVRRTPSWCRQTILRQIHVLFQSRTTRKREGASPCEFLTHLLRRHRPPRAVREMRADHPKAARESGRKAALPKRNPVQPSRSDFWTAHKPVSRPMVQFRVARRFFRRALSLARAAHWSGQLVGPGSVGGVALSADGDTVLWGDSSFTGRAWIFTRANGVWNQLGSELVGTGADRSGMLSARALGLSSSTMKSARQIIAGAG